MANIVQHRAICSVSARPAAVVCSLATLAAPQLVLMMTNLTALTRRLKPFSQREKMMTISSFSYPTGPPSRWGVAPVDRSMCGCTGFAACVQMSCGEAERPLVRKRLPRAKRAARQLLPFSISGNRTLLGKNPLHLTVKT